MTGSFRKIGGVGVDPAQWGERLREWREQNSLSRAELCALLKSKATNDPNSREINPDERLVYAWECGKTKRGPQAVYRRALEEVGAPIPATSSTVGRREVLSSGVILGGAALLPRWITKAATHAEITDTNVSDGWAALRRLTEIDNESGSADVAAASARISRELMDLARNGTCRSKKTVAGLQALSAASMAKTAWFAYDRGFGSDARHWWLEASHFSRLWGVHETAVQVNATMALQSASSVDHKSMPAMRGTETVALIRAAKKVTDQPRTPILDSLLLAREGVGHAVVGDGESARSALRQARRHVCRNSGGDEYVWYTFWGSSEVAVHEALAARAMGELETAARASSEALDLVDRDAFGRNFLNIAMYLSLILLELGRVDEALDTMSRVSSSLSAGVCLSGRVARRVQHALELLAASKSSSATQFLGETHDMWSTLLQEGEKWHG